MHHCCNVAKTVGKLNHYHTLRGSGGTVVMMTTKVNGETEILTPCKSETFKNFVETKIGLNDYVNPYNIVIFVEIGHVAEI